MNKTQVLQIIKDRAIIGIDEVGRGPWAGPLVVGAVMLDGLIPGLDDSKRLTGARRRILASLIQEQAMLCTTGWVWPDEIDTLGLTTATSLAIERALEGVTLYEYIVIDGSINYLPTNPKVLVLPKADGIIPAVSAASIVAKVARDQYMIDQAQRYPAYGFDSHVGYGTARHKQALIEHGTTPLHRLSFKPVREFIDEGGVS